jgi:redox-sensitive bicupin YhaK (pirin superfamily)
MTAGTGVRHSEFNHVPAETTHFLQIWLLPSRPGLEPGYEQKAFGDAEKRGRLRLVAAPDGCDGAVTLHADASIRAGLFDGDDGAELALDPSRLTYVHLARGELTLNGHALRAGDGARLEAETLLRLSDGHRADVLVFDLQK